MRFPGRVPDLGKVHGFREICSMLFCDDIIGHLNGLGGRICVPCGLGRVLWYCSTYYDIVGLGKTILISLGGHLSSSQQSDCQPRSKSIYNLPILKTLNLLTFSGLGVCSVSGSEATEVPIVGLRHPVIP